jgi:hypothetical protein
MIRKILPILLIILLAGIPFACRDPYNPPVVQQPNSYLVVDGFIDITAGDSSFITLSRTRNLSDSEQFVSERLATLVLEEENGRQFAFREKGNGRYYLLPQSFTAGKRYRLDIRTISGSQYASDFVQAKPTPPIDSVTWEKDNDVTIYAFTHDPTNNTRYYRWSFTETWEYDSFYDSNIGWNQNTFQLYYKDSTEMTTQCFRYAHSSDILIATTANLGQDAVDSQRVTRIQKGSERLSTRYSMELSQYALTKEGFEYWQLLKKNANQLGTLFDPQPSQITGNITCISNPVEPVIGFISVSSVVKKRIFIRHAEVAPWDDSNEAFTCGTPITTVIDSAVYYLQDGRYAPAYYITGGGLAVAPQHCVDCRTRGGTTTKPPYW